MGLEERKYDAYFRLALANFLDSTNMTCTICNYKYIDLDDVISRNVLLVRRENDSNLIACEKCVRG